jgi:hypothetical protein
MYKYGGVGDDVVPLSSFFDEFKIKPEEVDLFKLKIKVEFDGPYYEGESPNIYVILEYDNS